MKRLKPIVFALIALAITVESMAMPAAWAGDMMNVEFLQTQALKADPQVQIAQATANKILFDSVDADVNVTQLNVLATALYSATFYVHGPAEAYIGTIAGLVEIGNIMLEHIRPRRDRKNLANALAQLKTRMADLNTQVQTNYDAFKTGSTFACETLVSLAGPQAVAEVQGNLKQQDQPGLNRLRPASVVPCQ